MNVTTLRSPYVIAISSVVRLSSVTLVHPTHRLQLFVSIFALHVGDLDAKNYDHRPLLTILNGGAECRWGIKNRYFRLT